MPSVRKTGHTISSGTISQLPLWCRWLVAAVVSECGHDLGACLLEIGERLQTMAAVVALVVLQLIDQAFETMTHTA